MKRLSHILHFRHLDLLGMLLCLTLLSFKNYSVIPLAIFFLYKVKDDICLSLYILLCIVILSFIYIRQLRTIPTTLYQEVKVIDVIDKGTYNQVVVKANHINYIASDYTKEMHIGYVYVVDGKVERFSKQTIPYGFNQSVYYASKNIRASITIHDAHFVKKTYHIYHFRQMVIDYYQTKDLSPYVYMMMFGIPLQKETTASFQALGISHILSLSGIHIYIFMHVIKKLLCELDVTEHHQDIIILSLFVMITYFQRLDIGVLRLSLMYVCSLLEKRYGYHLSYLERLNSVFLCMIIVNMHVLYSLGFFMSYVILTAIAILEPIYRAYSPLIRRFIITSIIMLVLMPFQAKLSLISLIIMPLLGQWLAGLLYLTSLIVIIIPDFNNLSNLIFNSMESVLSLLESKAVNVIYGHMHDHMIPIYYLSLLYVFMHRMSTKKVLSMMLVVCSLFMTSYVSQNISRIIFLDVGQGDSTIIHTKDCIIVVDAYRYVSDYLMNQGIRKIDYLILTHSDNDHINEANTLIENFDVSYVVLSAYDQNYPIYNLETLRVSQGDHIACETINLHVLAPIKKGLNDNESSIVLQFSFDKLKVLLTGDIEHETETLLIDSYKHKLKSDVLKVSHHGSKTSSSFLFLYYVKPQYAIISAGRHNRYGFPHDDVIQRLSEVKAQIYRTDQLGSIVYTPSKKKSKWDFHLPF